MFCPWMCCVVWLEAQEWFFMPTFLTSRYDVKFPDQQVQLQICDQAKQKYERYLFVFLYSHCWQAPVAFLPFPLL